jgi:hypothetical protein
MKSSRDSVRGPTASRFESSRADRKGWAGMREQNGEILLSDGKLCDARHDSVHCTTLDSSAEEVPAPAPHERVARSGERQCSSAACGSWKALPVSDPRCSRKLRCVWSRVQTHHVHRVEVEDSSPRLEQVHLESDGSSHDEPNHRMPKRYA